MKSDAIGSEVFPFVCDRIEPFGDFLDLFVFEKDNFKGIIALSNYHRFIEVLPAIYDNVTQYPDTPYIQICKDGKVGLYGATLPIPPIYNGVYVPHFGWIKVKLHSQWGYIDSQGSFTDDINKAFLFHKDSYLTFYEE